MQRFLRKPCRRFVLVQTHVFRDQTADEAVHREVEGRVVPFDRLEKLADCDFRLQFLPNLALECLLGALSGLHLSSRELPPALPLAVSSLGCEYLGVLYDYCRYYFYCLHLNVCFCLSRP